MPTNELKLQMRCQTACFTLLNEIHTTLTHRYSNTTEWIFFIVLCFAHFIWIWIAVLICWTQIYLFLFSLLRLPHAVFPLIFWLMECFFNRLHWIFFISSFAWYHQADLQSAEKEREEKRRWKHIVNYLFIMIAHTWYRMDVQCVCVAVCSPQTMLPIAFVSFCHTRVWKPQTHTHTSLTLTRLGFSTFTMCLILPIWCKSMAIDLCWSRRLIGHFCNGDRMTEANVLCSWSEILWGAESK